MGTCGSTLIRQNPEDPWCMTRGYTGIYPCGYGYGTVFQYPREYPCHCLCLTLEIFLETEISSQSLVMMKATQTTKLNQHAEMEQGSSEIDSEGEDEAEAQTEKDEGALENKIGRALTFFDNIGLKIDDFLDGISWGDEACTQNAKIRNEQTRLLQSAKLPEILRHWATPRQEGWRVH